MRTTLLILALLLWPAVASAQSLVTRDAWPGARNVRVLHYDNQFLFLSRDHGNARDAGGNTEPGLFVHSKTHDHWLQMVEASTKDGKFGKSKSDIPEENNRLRMSSVAWDFTPYANKPSIELPLKGFSFIAFPEKIELDAAGDRYKLSFFTNWKIESVVTILYVSRKELTEQFDKIAKP